MPHRIFAIFTWVASLFWMAAATSATLDRAPPTPRFETAPCAFHDVPPDWGRQNGVDCGWLHVPESRTKFTGRMLRIWVAIARANQARAKPDPLVYVHGGPGIATVDHFFPFLPQSKTWPAFRHARDLVFFDQRGTGRSEPDFCPELRTASEALEREAPPAAERLQRRKTMFAACGRRLEAEGLDFAAYNSTATVQDLEDLRQALGVARWNIYGISYGSLVGFEYLRRAPGSVRAAILDSVFPPNSPHGAEQITASGKAFESLQHACNSQPACRSRFPDILGRLSTATSRLDSRPLALKDGRIDGASFSDAVWTMLVKSASAPWVPLVVDSSAAGNDEVIRAVVEIFGDSGSFGDFNVGQAMAVSCYEVFGGATRASERHALARYPQLGFASALPEETDEVCDAFQPQRAPMEHYAPVRSDIPVLLYGGNFDPATPFEDAVLAAKNLPNGTLVRVDGSSHAAMGRDDCTRGIAHAFLADPWKAPDLKCLANRPRVEIPIAGLEDYIESMKK